MHTQYVHELYKPTTCHLYKTKRRATENCTKLNILKISSILKKYSGRKKATGSRHNHDNDDEDGKIDIESYVKPVSGTKDSEEES